MSTTTIKAGTAGAKAPAKSPRTFEVTLIVSREYRFEIEAPNAVLARKLAVDQYRAKSMAERAANLELDYVETNEVPL